MRSSRPLGSAELTEQRKQLAGEGPSIVLAAFAALLLLIMFANPLHAQSCDGAPDGTACDDANFCTTNDTCLTGVCSGVPLTCDDGIACTQDICDASNGTCVHMPDNSICDDGSFCNGQETCDAVAGCLAGEPVTCDDGIACTLDSCDPSFGGCVHVPDDSICDDGVFCNGVETCDAGAGCSAGEPPNPDDGDECTSDYCDEDLDELIHIPIDACTPNTPPVLNAVGNRTVAEGEMLNILVSATDADGDTVTFSVTGAASGATLDSITGAFSWTPGFDAAGSYTNVTFTAADPHGGTDSESITITVTNVNRAPVLSPIGDRSVAENALLSFTIAASDTDGDALTYAATGLPIGATLHPTTGAFSWTPDYTQSGSYPVTFTASDGTGSASEAIAITVTNVNGPPVLWPIGDRSVAENSLLLFTITASDPDDDAVTFGVMGLPFGAIFIGNDGAFSWTPGYNQSGSYPVTFTASDGTGTASQTITITVTNVNRAPVLAPIGNRSVAENALLAFTISGSDPDGGGLSYHVTGLPSGATFGEKTGAFSWTPSYDQSGTYPVTFTVSDGTDTASETITIAVTDVPIATGVVKAVHLTELRTAVNAVRALAGLGGASWTDPSPQGVVIKAIHWTELRDRLNEARAVLGLPPVSFPSPVTPGAVVQGAHVQALREGVW